jgi:small subunit ribosomal protein S2
MASIDPKDLLTAGAHFGHKTSRWHPKMAQYIHGVRGDVHIIDLIQTASLLEDALTAVEKAVSGGKQVLLVGTKRQAHDPIRKVAEEHGQPYVVERWLGGMMTNWNTMIGRIKKLKKLEEQMANGELEAKYNKLEVQRFQEEIDHLNHVFGGVKDMKGMPGLVFVVDVNREQTAIQEAKKLGIPVIALVDTNVDPSGIDFPVPANDDAIKTIEFVLDQIASAIATGASQQKKATDKEEAVDAKGTTTKPVEAK